LSGPGGADGRPLRGAATRNPGERDQPLVQALVLQACEGTPAYRRRVRVHPAPALLSPAHTLDVLGARADPPIRQPPALSRAARLARSPQGLAAQARVLHEGAGGAGPAPCGAGLHRADLGDGEGARTL